MKEDRRQLIKRLISENRVGTQEELVNLLYNEGYRVTQATVSRDVREMKITKTSTDMGVSFYQLPHTEEAALAAKYKSIIASSVKEITKTKALIVINTLTGTAMAVASAIDDFGWEEVVGCIAGDDVIFIATLNDIDTDILIEKLEKAREV